MPRVRRSKGALTGGAAFVALAVLAALTTLAGGAPEEGAAGDAGPDVRVVLPAYPFTPSSVATRDPAFLDALAAEYVRGRPREQVDVEDFLYSWAPVTLFNRIIAGDTRDIAKMRWVMQVSGHFGAVWLRAGLPGRRGEGRRRGGSLGDTVAAVKAAAAAAAGPPDALFAYNERSLLAFIWPGLGIASNFGYNKGYLLEIVQRPPKGLAPPTDFVTCDGVLWCTFRDRRVPALAKLRPVAERLAAGRGRAKDLAAAAVSQRFAEVLGRVVWGSFFKKDGMTAGFYARLLDVSASFLEVVQAAGLLSAKGYIEKDVEAGRAGARVQSGLLVWLGAYMGGFSNSAGPDAPLPRLVIVER